MNNRRALVAVSLVQLGGGLAGQRLAVRDGRAFDIALVGWRGRPERIRRDRWLLGTGLSAPVVMLTAQAAGTVRLAVGPSRAATTLLGALGAAMSGGYLVEREFRAAVSPSGWDPAVTPVAASGFLLSVVMALVALGDTRRPSLSRG
jgi:hypothetical protein